MAEVDTDEERREVDRRAYPLKLEAQRLAARGYLDHIDRLQAENQRLTDEIESVLQLMDGLAGQWGDEGVFRRCRDRLRALTKEVGQ